MLEEEVLGGAGAKGEALTSFSLHLLDDVGKESFRGAARSVGLEARGRSAPFLSVRREEDSTNWIAFLIW